MTETKKINGVTVGETNYQYDNNGNMTSDGTSTYKYDGFNQLIEVYSGSNVYKYSYDGDGKRTSKTINGTITNYVWDGSDISYEVNGSGTETAKYILGVNVIASDIGGTRRFYLYNGHGDVTQLTDTGGNVIKNYGYDAFGNERSIDPNDVNPFRYSAQYFDKETGKLYLGSRYYDAGTGRFISQDSNTGKPDDPLSLNLYTYCNNDPVDGFDPDGHSVVDVVFLCMDAAEFYSNPTLANAAWVGLDIITTFDASGMVNLAIRAKKTGKIFDDAIAILQAVDKARDLQKQISMLPKAAEKWDSLRIVSARSGRFTKNFGGAAEGISKANYKQMSNSDLIQEIATRSENAVNKRLTQQGKSTIGRFAGTEKHSYAERMLKKYQGIFDKRGLEVETSYKNRIPVSRGKKGSTRLDVFDPSTGTVWDYKFTINPGQGLKQKQIRKIQNNGPLNINPNRIIEVNP